MPPALSPWTYVGPAGPSSDAVAVEPGEHRVDVVGRRREPVLRGQPVVDAEHRHVQPVREPPARPVVHVDVVEDEAAAVQVHHHARVGARRAVEPDRHPVGVEVDDLGDVLRRLLERCRPVGVARRRDVVPLGPDGGVQRGGLDGRSGLGMTAPAQRPIIASMATATAAATRKSTRGSGTRTV